MTQANHLKKSMAITTLVCLLLISAIFYFFIMPQVQNIKKTKKQIENQRLELERKYIQGQNLKELSENIKIVREKMPELEKIYIKKEESLEFITTLERIAEKNGVAQKLELSQANEAAVSGKAYTESFLQISLNGPYLNLLSYLKDIETLRYCVNIENLEISSQAVRSEGIVENINLNIQANIYWYNDKDSQKNNKSG